MTPGPAHHHDSGWHASLSARDSSWLHSDSLVTTGDRDRDCILADFTTRRAILCQCDSDARAKSRSRTQASTTSLRSVTPEPRPAGARARRSKAAGQGGLFGQGLPNWSQSRFPPGHHASDRRRTRQPEQWPRALPVVRCLRSGRPRSRWLGLLTSR